MYEYKGKSVFGGIAIGRIKVYSKEQQQVKRMHIDDCESEKQRYLNEEGRGMNFKYLYF